jgi:hypothetical protein
MRDGMMSRIAACSALLGGLLFTACVDELPLPVAGPGDVPAADVPEGPSSTLVKPDPPGPPAAPNCATPTVDRFTGTASRTSEQYPDDVEATITWERVATSGCIDRYVPSGEAHYRFAIPGALCTQTVAPDVSAIAGAHGMLAIDRSTSPATYVATGETTWQVTWSCQLDDGSTDTMTFAAGGLWLSGAGTVEAGAIQGTRLQPDGLQCGRGESTTGCTYAWAFSSAL